MVWPRLGVKLKQSQREVFDSTARFRVVAAGRRFGKTHLGLAEMLRAANGLGRKAWYVAPSYRQGKRVAWQRLKSLSRPWWDGPPNETDLSVKLVMGGTVAVRGADRPDSLRGDGLDFVVLDEFASMWPETWTEVIRPALSDRGGRALFIGTPRGCNHFYERFEQAKETEDWAAFQFTSLQGENVTELELAKAAKELDLQTFRQEFEAEFGGAGLNRAYYAFDRKENVRELAYAPSEPLIWALDFNVDPMCAVIAQKVGETVHVLDEIVVRVDGTTERACSEFLTVTEKWRKYGVMKVDVYGDASGNQRRSSSTNTDWGIVRDFFSRWKGTYVGVVKSGVSNPGVRDRVNCLNAKLQSADGERRLFVDGRCRELIRDLERVSWLVDEDGRVVRGELDKRDRERTHCSDALGYYLAGAGLGIGKGVVGMRGDGRLF